MARFIQGLLLLFSVMVTSSPAMAQQTQPAQGYSIPGIMLPGFGTDDAQDADAKQNLAQWQQTFSDPQGCWGCTLFSSMATVTMNVGKKGEAIFKEGAIAAVNAFMGLWVVWQLFLLASPTNANNPVQSIDTIFLRIVLMMVALFVLRQGPFQYIMVQYVFPTLGAVMQAGTSLISSGGGGCNSSGGGGEAASLVKGGSGLMCAMHLQMGKGMGVGAFLMDSAQFSVMPGGKFELFKFVGGLIIFLSFMMMLIMLPFRLFDAMIRIAVVSIILPLVVLAYLFKPTRGVVKQAVTSLLAAGLTFFFTAVAVAISVDLLQELLGPLFSALEKGDADKVVGPLTGTEFMSLIAAAVGMAAFIKQAGSLASEFAGFQGSMGDTGGAGAAAVGGAVVAAGSVAGYGAGKVSTKAGGAALAAGKAGWSKMADRGGGGGDGGTKAGSGSPAP